MGLGGGAGAPPSPLLAVPITVLLYDGPLLCGFNVAIKGLMRIFISTNNDISCNIHTTRHYI